MKRVFFLGSMVLAMSFLLGCPSPVAERIFPILPPEPLSPPPLAPGPFAVEEYRFELPVGADLQPVGYTIYVPLGADGPLPTLVWVLGVNNRAYFHEFLHQHLASNGIAVVVPDTRDLRFLDRYYHLRNTLIARQAFATARCGKLGFEADPDRMALGGYSVGGSLAAFTAAYTPEAAALVFWAPSPAPIWQGVEPDALFPRITQPALYVLGELDDVAPPDAWPATMMAAIPHASVDELIIEDGVHLFFQQPSGVDDRNPPTPITRPEQMAAAVSATLSYLSDIFAL